MRKVKLTEATASLAEYTQKLNRGPLVVTVKGKPVAALVPIEGMDWESLCVGTSPSFLDMIERSRRRTETEGTISDEEMRRRHGLPPYVEPKANARNHKPKAKSRKSKTRS